MIRQGLHLNRNQTNWLLLFFFLGLTSRLIPHLPNMTPLISLSIIANLKLNRWYTIGLLLIILLISDTILSFLFKYPMLGYWSCFTYTGFLFNSFIFSYRRRTRLYSLLNHAFMGTMFFWIWTNFGVWLTSGLYTKTIAGFGLCYFNAIPFLRNAMIGSMIWMLIYYFTLQSFSKKSSLGEIAT